MEALPQIVQENKRILDLLGQGISAVQVVSITGVSPKYLKAIIEDEEFGKALELRRKENAKEAVEDEIVGSKYLALEHSILRQIESDLPNAEFRDVVKALEVVSKRQDAHLNRKIPANNSTTVINNVQLLMPAHAMPEYVLNSNKEVVSVGGQALAPMSTEGVMNLFDAKKEGQKLVSQVA